MNSPSPQQSLFERAKAALEQGDPESLALFDHAIRSDPGNAELWLGKARALELTGDRRGARLVAQQLADQAPSFLAAQALLAELRLADGDADFTSHYAAASKKHPRDPNIPAALCEVLAGLDRADKAADAAAAARRQFPNEPYFALLEAIHGGAAGQWVRVDAIYAKLTQNNPDRWLHEARHRLRGGDPTQADALLDKAIGDLPWDIVAWALRGIAWRVLDDPRAEWLHGQADLVQFRPLAGPAKLIEQAVDQLREIHARSSMPLGQSLRGGTQTRGILFERPDPFLQQLQRAIQTTLDHYRADLPQADSSHPLLRHAATDWQLQGSWSVRLTGGGDHHTAHVHPQGIISSALYLVIPKDVAATSDDANTSGWLEIGRPPTDLGLDLPPLRSIQPQAGHLALFPSTLYHGTAPFDAGERMTIAFDVIASD